MASSGYFNTLLGQPNSTTSDLIELPASVTWEMLHAAVNFINLVKDCILYYSYEYNTVIAANYFQMDKLQDELATRDAIASHGHWRDLFR